MAQGKIKGFINKVIAGSEKAEGYARGTLPSNRWELFWDILKGRFGKLIIINLLIAIFLIPLILLILMRIVGMTNMGASYPFSMPFGTGYGAPISMAGYPEAVTFNIDLIILMFLPLTFFVASLGISGGAYVIRNMVWTEGIFVANDFWRGIKQNWKQMAVIFLIYSLVFYVTVIGVELSNRVIALGATNSWIYVVTKVLAIIILVIYSIVTLHMVSMSVTYDLKFKHLLKNALIFTIGLPIHNIFFVAVGLVFAWLTLFGGSLAGVGLVLLLVFGISFFLLVWTDYCHWIYDRFVNDKVKGAQKNRGIYEKVKGSDSEALKKYREQVDMTSSSVLAKRPIKPITDEELAIAELPTSFNRSDIHKLRESKEVIYEDNKRYIEERRNDPRFAEFFAERDGKPTPQNPDEAERQKRIEKAKRELAKRDRKKKK